MRAILRIILMTLLFFSSVYASDSLKAKTIFQVEDPSHTALPSKVQNALKTNNPDAYSQCDLVGSLIDIGSIKSEKYYAVAGKEGECSGSASAPVWIVQENKEKAGIILSAGGLKIEALSRRNNGLNDLRISGGDVGSAFVQYWQYNGTAYLMKTKKEFDSSCKNLKNDPDNPFNCRA